MNKKNIILLGSVIAVLLIIIAAIIFLRMRDVDGGDEFVHVTPVVTTTTTTDQSSSSTDDAKVIPGAAEPIPLSEEVESNLPPTEPPAGAAVTGTEAEAPLATDTDGDSIPDNEEARYGTDPNKKDTDGDTFADADEIKNGYNPLGPGRCAVSTCIIK